MTDVTWVNGRFVRGDEPAIAVDDRGFQFGDSVYEVVRIYAGRPFRFEAHLDRFERSLHAIAMDRAVDRRALTAAAKDCLKKAAEPDALLYFQVTRGVQARAHLPGSALVPTLVVTVRKFTPPSEAAYAAGVSAIVVPDIRWRRCDIKSTNLLGNVLARAMAEEKGASQAIFVRSDGTITESAASNVFAVIDGDVRTHPEGPFILSGVTRSAVLECAQSCGLRVREEPCFSPELSRADEIFLSGTSVEVVSVTTLDGLPVGDGRRGPASAMLHAAFRRLVAAETSQV